MTVGLSLERFAELRAEIELGRLRDEVLRGAEISVGEWVDAQERWLGKLGEELQLGRFELQDQYTQAFLVCQRRLLAESSAQVTAERSTREGESPSETSARAATSPSEAPRDAMAQDQPFVAPPAAPAARYPLQDVVARAAPVDLHVHERIDIDATGAMPALTPAQLADDGMPFAGAAGAAPTPVASDVVREAADLLGGTAIGPGLGVLTTLPFGNVDPAREVRDDVAESSVDGTAFFSALTDADLADPLPFGVGEGSVPASIVPSLSDEPWPSGDEPTPPSTSVDETGMIDNALLEEALRDGSLPFGGSRLARDAEGTRGIAATSVESLQSAAAVAPAASDRTAFMQAIVVDDEPLPFASNQGAKTAQSMTESMAAPHPQAGATKRLVVDSSSLSAAMPFQPVTAAGAVMLGHLTLQQFAALETEIAHGLGRIHEILETFQVSRASYLALKQDLERRCADPELRRFYEQERDAYARWRSSR